MGDFFQAHVECCSLWLNQKGPLGPKVILPDGQTDGQTMGLRELDILINMARCDKDILRQVDPLEILLQELKICRAKLDRFSEVPILESVVAICLGTVK